MSCLASISENDDSYILLDSSRQLRKAGNIPGILGRLRLETFFEKKQVNARNQNMCVSLNFSTIQNNLDFNFCSCKSARIQIIQLIYK